MLAAGAWPATPGAGVLPNSEFGLKIRARLGEPQAPELRADVLRVPNPNGVASILRSPVAATPSGLLHCWGGFPR